MKVLSIREPWATLIINGYKEYEFRNWKTKYRGEVLIHASKAVEKEYLTHFDSLNLDLASGEIIGKVTLADCVEVTKDFEEKLIKENPFIYKLSEGRGKYAFKVENVVKFDKKIPVKGSLGLWNYEGEIAI